ncbi:MAG: metallopeptidase family protein [Actinomycetota bacterium]|nr:metallopeptidase family protein [Actinomycetota bacterium]
MRFDEEDRLSDSITEDEFEAMVADAIDALPQQFRQALERVPVIISDRGWERRAYGLYEGDGIARDNWPDRITIFRDTLVRDFGHDRSLLAAEVERVVRHELGHHLGYGEKGVQELGL